MFLFVFVIIKQLFLFLRGVFLSETKLDEKEVGEKTNLPPLSYITKKLFP
jgi:hypothetical protein